MKFLSAAFATTALFAATSFSRPAPAPASRATPAKIQVAILLDVSGSMQGLIEQAKAQLWNMVTTLGKAQCTDNTTPQVELALYEYGRPADGADKGYIKQLSPFTRDLDAVSQILFSLHTDGGDEYCGQVIYTSIDQLSWDASNDNYKVIFIAGNEDFLQGTLHYTKACTKAKEKGVIVNTIYCGPYQQGIAEHWNLGGECGSGSFTNINQNATENDIPTPYDTTLIVLNTKLNGTYVAYGNAGVDFKARQMQMDEANFAYNTKVAAKRVEAKARGNVYNNAGWDLVDGYISDSTHFVSKLDRKTLPDSLKSIPDEKLKIVIREKAAERSAIQRQILEVNNNRTKFIAEQKARDAVRNNEKTLESEVEKIIKEQVQRFNMKIE